MFSSDVFALSNARARHTARTEEAAARHLARRVLAVAGGAEQEGRPAPARRSSLLSELRARVGNGAATGGTY